MHITRTALIYLVTRATNRVPAGSDTGYFERSVRISWVVLDSSYQIVPGTMTPPAHLPTSTAPYVLRAHLLCMHHELRHHLISMLCMPSLLPPSCTTSCMPTPPCTWPKLLHHTCFCPCPTDHVGPLRPFLFLLTFCF